MSSNWLSSSCDIRVALAKLRHSLQNKKKKKEKLLHGLPIYAIKSFIESSRECGSGKEWNNYKDKKMKLK